MCEDLLHSTVRLYFEIHPHYFHDVDNMKHCVICDVTSASTGPDTIYLISLRLSDCQIMRRYPMQDSCCTFWSFFFSPRTEQS